MKNILFAVLVTASTAFATTGEDSFKIPGTCDEPVVCAMLTGEFSEGTATMADGTMLKSNGADATCCQLASALQSDACADGLDPVGLEVSCK